MKTVLYHPTGNANVRAAALGFARANILANFYTSIATFEGDFLDKVSTIGPLSELRRRRFDLSLKSLTKQWPWLEAGRLLSSKAGINWLLKHETGVFSIDSVYKSLDLKVAASLEHAKKNGVKGIYAYEDGAAASFAEARKLGLKAFYDLPIGYWRTGRTLLKKELEYWPEWAPTMTGVEDSNAKLQRKDEEIQMADHIFVASRFTAKTLEDFPGKLPTIDVIPYGFPPVAPIRSYSSLLRKKKLQLLYVGRLEQRKGIANLFAAVEGFEEFIELTIVGLKSTNDCQVLNNALAKHKYVPSLAHDEILKLMRQQDVLIFPSLFEGFGLVITEAMSQGTPVITTERTAGPDLITNGENGWLIEAGSTEAIREIFQQLLSKPSVIAKAGKESRERAILRPWAKYGQELSDAVARYL